MPLLKIANVTDDLQYCLDLVNTKAVPIWENTYVQFPTWDHMYIVYFEMITHMFCTLFFTFLISVTFFHLKLEPNTRVCSLKELQVRIFAVVALVGHDCIFRSFSRHFHALFLLS